MCCHSNGDLNRDSNQKCAIGICDSGWSRQEIRGNFCDLDSAVLRFALWSTQGSFQLQAKKLHPSLLICTNARLFTILFVHNVWKFCSQFWLCSQLKALPESRNALHQSVCRHGKTRTCQESLVDTAPNIVPTFCVQTSSRSSSSGYVVPSK